VTGEALERLLEHDPVLIGIGASSGAIEALGQLLPELPPRLTAALTVVIHVPPDRHSGLPELLSAKCALPILEADDKTSPLPGHVYFAPPNYHLLVEDDGCLALSTDEPVHFSRPSIDVLFESLAHAFGRRALGILLSGANADGAAGLATIKARGGLTWVQSPHTARASTMPEAALRLAEHAVLDPGVMGQTLAAWGHHER
jgi:two-component system, chemotaxis family, protein-glutamate methylesterase/glutaminase